MRRTMVLLMTLAAVSSDAAVLCTAKSGSATVRVRTTCRRHERQLDPAALDLQGPAGRGTAFEAPADTPPGSPSPLDDEFNNPSVDGKWSWVNQGSATIAASPNGYTTLGAYSVAPRIYSSPTVSDPTNPNVRPVFNLPFYGSRQSFGDRSNGAVSVPGAIPLPNR